MRSRSVSTVTVALAVVLVAGACSTKKEGTTATATSGPSVTMKTSDEVEGNVVTLALAATGITIVKPDGDTSGKSGHFHIFIDREPPAAGETMPKEPGIVHSFNPETKIYGLSIGEHTFTAVLGNGSHQRIGDAKATAKVKVEGPSLDASAPATVPAGAPVPIAIKLDGAAVAAANGDTSGATGHFHLFIDREPPVQGAIPKEDGIVHTTETSYAVQGLAAGEHTIWVVFGNGNHEPFPEPIMDKVVVTVG